MKKKTMLSAILLLTVSVISYAQNNQGDSVLRNKHGHAILPKAGDIALGFDAIPVIDFFLNSPNFLLSGNSNSSNGAGTLVHYTSNLNNQITGKYFLDDKTAIRVRFGYNTLSGNVTNPVQDAQAMYNAEQTSNFNNVQAASNQRVIDKLQFAKTNIMLQGGIERRRGYGRLQGFYGAEFGVGLLKDNSWTTYGNNFCSVFPTTYTTDFASGGTSVQDPTSGSTYSRNLDTLHTATWTFSLRAFIGVEYFFFPKISIGAEFGWAYAVTLNQGYSVDNETYYNGSAGPVDVVQTINNGGQHIQHGFSVDNNNGQTYAVTNSIGSAALTGASGSIVLLFHF